MADTADALKKTIAHWTSRPKPRCYDCHRAIDAMEISLSPSGEKIVVTFLCHGGIEKTWFTPEEAQSAVMVHDAFTPYYVRDGNSHG